VSWLLIFDFDGVIADSEALANLVLAEAVSEFGMPTTLEAAYKRYMGKPFGDVIAIIESDIGKKLPTDFADQIQNRTFERFRQELKAVDGVERFIETFSQFPRCIASTSSAERIRVCLDVMGLRALFEPHIFSVSEVPRSKPHPDVFLHAARQLSIPPSRSLVIEDSIRGVQAGVAAGMVVIGILAASHIQSGTRERLRDAGAHYVADTFEEATMIAKDLLTA
jgi:HAD superfamily hydrolase (TIGR01509 family)